MMTMVGFSGAPGSAALTNIAGLADQTFTVNGNNITMTAPMLSIVGLYARGAHLARAQVFTPSMLRNFTEELLPIDVSATPQIPQRFIDLRSDPISIQDEEFMQALSIDATGAEVTDTFVWLADGPISPIVTGQIFTARATATTTLVANTWTNCAITFTSVLPSGRYQIVGMWAESAGMIAARVVVPGFEWRPGVIGVTSLSGIALPNAFRMGNFGEFATFKNTVQPTVDVYSLSADTAEIFGFDLVYLGMS